MLFRQKEKVADIGKDNFREFFKREDDACAVTQKKLHGSQSMKISHQQQSSIADGSMRMLGSTFDAQHLGTFLQKSQFATSGTRVMRLTEPFNSSLKNQSFFFRNQQPRLQDNIDYLHMTQLNHLILEHPTKPNPEYIDKKMLSVPEKKFSTISYDQTAKLQQPSEKLQQLRMTKEQQVEYQKWRSEFQDVNRSYKKAKRAFKSGLIGLDTPLQEGTQIYAQEHAEQKQKMTNAINHSVKRLKSLERFNCTNPAIEFDNVKSGMGTQFPSQSHEFRADWMRKKSIEQAVDTKNRLFGQVPAQNHSTTLRALQLQQHEMRGRDYNAVTLTKV